MLLIGWLKILSKIRVWSSKVNLLKKDGGSAGNEYIEK
jgi:hypothetical protein